MAFPASAVPSGNSYSAHFAAAPSGDALTLAAAATAALLLPRKVDVRQHIAGDSPEASARRALLTGAGGKASAFSPAPTPDAPGEGFWKTTLAVVRAGGEDEDFWWPPRADKKVEWDCLLLALREGGPDGLSEDRIRHPDLWIARDPDGRAEAAEWVRRGAGAAVVLSPAKLTWASRNAVFGRSAGERAFGAPIEAELAYAGCAGGVIDGLFEDLLGDNLFDKTWVRVDRDDLEARPLRLSRACATAAAAARVAAANPGEPPERLLHKSGELTGRVRALLRAEIPPEGEAKPWGSKGRK